MGEIQTSNNRDEKKAASEQSLQLLYKNMGESICMFFPILNNCVNTFNAINQIVPNKISDENTRNKFILWKNLLSLELILLHSNIEIATSLRADFHSTLLNEKRYNLKFINVTTLEGYKYLLSFGKAKNKSVWHEIKKLADKSNDQEFKDECISIEKKLECFGNKETNKRLREVAVHFSKSPIQVYNDLMEISEEKEVKRASAFMAILQSISIFINKYINKYQLLSYISSLPSDEIFLWEKINHFVDQENHLYEKMGAAIPIYSKRLEQFVKLYNIPDKVKEHLNLDKNSINQLNHLLESFQPSIHIVYLYLDIACAVRAYLKSEYYIEKQLNLRRINVIVYEGFKLLYGYTEEEQSESFWNKNISSTIAQSTDSASNILLNNIEVKLRDLSQNSVINNPDLRHLSVHYRDKRINNIPLIFKKLIRLNPILEMDKSLKLLKILPPLFEAMQSAVKIVHKDAQIQQQKS